MRAYGRVTKLELYELPDAGVARHLGAVELGYAPMLHDFIATDTHLVFFVSPVRLDVPRMLLSIGSFEQLFRWRPEQGTEVICVPIDRPTEVLRFTTSAFYQWHFANAFGRANELIVDYVRYATFDGVLVDAKAWQVGDKHYVALSASEDRELAEKHADAELAMQAAQAAADKAKAAAQKSETADAATKEDEAKPVLDPAPDREQRIAAIGSEVEKLNSVFKGWSFVLPGYKNAEIEKSMNDLLKPLESAPPLAKSKAAKAGK